MTSLAFDNLERRQKKYIIDALLQNHNIASDCKCLVMIFCCHCFDKIQNIYSLKRYVHSIVDAAAMPINILSKKWGIVKAIH